MKVVINTCFGGFSLSPRAVKRYAELCGRECYFYTHQTQPQYNLHKQVPISLEKAEESSLFWQAFNIPNANEILAYNEETWREDGYNERYEKHSLSSGRKIERHDPKLIQVVEELGGEASGHCAELRIVEIPDGTDYEIEKYDGLEHIAEKHRTWR